MHTFSKILLFLHSILRFVDRPTWLAGTSQLLIGDTSEIHGLSNEKNPGGLGFIGDYSTQLYRDYNKPL